MSHPYNVQWLFRAELGVCHRFFQSLQTMNTEIIDLVTGEEKAEEFLELPCDMPTAKGSINRQLAPEVPLMQVMQ